MFLYLILTIQVKWFQGQGICRALRHPMINPQSFVIYNLALGNILIFILTKLEHFPVHFSLPSLMPVTHRLLSPPTQPPTSNTTRLGHTRNAVHHSSFTGSNVGTEVYKHRSGTTWKINFILK